MNAQGDLIIYQMELFHYKQLPSKYLFHFFPPYLPQPLNIAIQNKKEILIA